MALRNLAKDVCTRLGTSFAYGGAERIISVPALFSRTYANVAEGLKYAKSHEWVKIEGDSATIGISDFAQEQLGDVVYVELPEVDSEFEKDAAFGVVESVKTASDVYMPVAGTVTATNGDLADNTDTLNADAYGKGWLVKVKLSDPAGAGKDLMDAEAYSKHIEH